MADLKINSRFGLLSILTGPEKEQVREALKAGREIKVQIEAWLVDEWSNDDGVDQEFQLEVESVMVINGQV